MADTSNPVIIYSTTWCAYCKLLKQYLDNKGVEWVEKDIERDADAYHELMEETHVVCQYLMFAALWCLDLTVPPLTLR